MYYLAELSKEHPSLPLAELRSIAKVVGVEDNLAVVEGKFAWKRLALTKQVSKFLFKGENLGQFASTLKTESFAVRFKSRASMERKLGRVIKGKVDLEKPKTTFVGHVGETSKDYYFGELLWERKSFESRKVQNRPYFHPTSIHPKYARVLVNMSRVQEGETLLDPFCGTGGILIEAGLVKATPVGIDHDVDMVAGSKKNLDFCKVIGEVFKGDARKLKGEFDAIATDPPYGRASAFTGKELEKLYKSSLKSMFKVLKEGRYLAIIAPQEIEVETLAADIGFELVERHFERVHKSLSRFYYVFKKPKA